MLTLRDTPDNPVPPGGTLVPVVTSDGITLRAAHWTSTGRMQKGTVCLVQGRAEFIEKYYETIGDLRARGFAVVAFDWRGHGESARVLDDPHRGHIGRFEEYRRDLKAIEDAVLRPSMPHPHVCLAHSMGGAVVLTGAVEGWLPFRRIVTVAPMLGLTMVRWPRVNSVAARLLQRIGLGQRYIAGGNAVSIATKPFEGNRLSGDRVRYARNARAAQAVGAGAVGDPSIAWAAEAFRAMARLRDLRLAGTITIPTLIVAAGADPVCCTATTERFGARMRVGDVIVLPGARHEILSETDVIRDRFWAAFDAFVPGTAVAEADPAALAVG
ncbi:alpha/beta hydrolase [Methylobacterium sp. Leaf399]|uniref:alpha/beta fold hydrolase n=1 Tax=Methylobacterium sp. Leaf399 TaxID=1736364 RepID=UPI0006F49A05|nr:alpha/beta hydrolase [Methylobacterium sp. Leaf399]KQT14884.1 alpha/beta hydrolase [Methylobacterium sp. Leaf399]